MASGCNGFVTAGLGVSALVTASILYLGGAEAQTAGILPYEDAGRVANGATLYAEYCAACHGADLEGERPDWRIPDAEGFLPAPPHDETGHTWHHDDLLLFRIVALGTEAVVGGTYRSNMTGFSEVLTEAEILDTLAFIKSTWPKEVIRRHDDINLRAGVVRQ